MRNITYKYNVGDIVRFKDKFHSTASCDLKKLAGTTGVVEERRDYNGPCYKLAGGDSFYEETCFEGPALSKFFTQRDEAVGADTLQGHETKCDTEGSGESNDRAKCRELYLKALKKTYGKVPFETETVEVGSLLEFTEAVLETTKEV